MKAHLTFETKDFVLDADLPLHVEQLMQDLELPTLLSVMAGDDELLHKIAKTALLTAPDNSIKDIRYRQDCLRDSLAHQETIRRIHGLAIEAIESEKKGFFSLYHITPDNVLRRSVEVLGLFIPILRQLREVADAQAQGFRSTGFRNMFAMLQRDLDDDYFEEMTAHLERLRFREGLLVTSRLGAGNRGADYQLNTPPRDERMWPLTLWARQPEGYTIRLHPRDEAGYRALSNLRDQGQVIAATALGCSVEHILAFFTMLRIETGFYVAALNLRNALSELKAPVTMPVPRDQQMPALVCHSLIDVSLSLSMKKKAVGNDIAGDDKQLIIVTGANQGGKSTFLRSLGLAQLMMQAGLFVVAEQFEASVVDGVFTHYKRGEDSGMQSGKFDEELRRMDALVSGMTSYPLVLFNESFASTNEREGSEVARQIVDALLEHSARVVFVTHMYEFAHAFEVRHADSVLFLRADRRDDGSRSFSLVAGPPSDTGFGHDLYLKVFGPDATAPAASHNGYAR